MSAHSHNHTSLDQMFLQRIEEIISREKWLAGDPMRDIQKHAAPEPITPDVTAAASKPVGPPQKPLSLGGSPTVLILMLVVLILFLVVLIVYIMTL